MVYNSASVKCRQANLSAIDKIEEDYDRLQDFIGVVKRLLSADLWIINAIYTPEYACILIDDKDDEWVEKASFIRPVE
ncbi:hypothetical protein H0H93_006794 [Arthromyces matolae]|nr:hypothetical protein H0H93_006794 [Arthromyces matolae]